MRSAAGSTDRSICLDQAELLLDRAYVHLALKRAMHGVDPVQRVKVLRGRADALSDADFRRQLQRIFLTTRDMHTAFTFSDGGERVAVLPFRLDRCFVAERPRLSRHGARIRFQPPAVRAGSRGHALERGARRTRRRRGSGADRRGERRSA